MGSTTKVIFSVGARIFDWRPPVLAFLAFFGIFCLLPKNVRLETLQFTDENCKQIVKKKNNCGKINSKLEFLQIDKVKQNMNYRIMTRKEFWFHFNQN